MQVKKKRRLQAYFGVHAVFPPVFLFLIHALSPQVKFTQPKLFIHWITTRLAEIAWLPLVTLLIRLM